MESHKGGIPPLSIEVLSKFPGDPALRQVTVAETGERNLPNIYKVVSGSPAKCFILRRNDVNR